MNLRRAFDLLMGSKSGGERPTASSPPVLDQYIPGYPNPQNAVDLIPGWNHAFPPQAGVVAGDAHLYDDARIRWCVEQAGSIEGATILELGPLEAFHTYMLAQENPARIDAIEANSLAYLKCLITKETLGIANARFLLGDFYAWLDGCDITYDLIVASGVLYHSSKPVDLISSISNRTRAFYIWTHYFDDCLLSQNDTRGQAFTGRTSVAELRGSTVTLYERSYHHAWHDPKFCGGLQDIHNWLNKADIIRVIDLLGFDVALAHDDVDHPGGPAFSLFAKRREGSEGEVGQTA